jgi:hypothetical protein
MIRWLLTTKRWTSLPNLWRAPADYWLIPMLLAWRNLRELLEVENTPESSGLTEMDGFRELK